MNIVCLLFLVILNLGLIKIAGADELSDLKDQLKQVQQQMQDMQEKIEALETGKQAQVETPKALEDRVIALEAKAKKPWPEGMLSLKGDNWRLGGKFEFDFVDTKKHAGINEKAPHFNFNAFKLYPDVSFGDDISLKGEIEFGRTSVELKKMYLLFNNLPAKSFLKAGVDYRFIRPSRKTVRYPLAGNAFWRDSEAGIFTGGEVKPLPPLYWRFSYTSGLSLNQSRITEDDSLKMIHDNLRTSGYVSPGEFGLGLGYKNVFFKSGKLDTLAFCYLGRISSADATFLKTNVTGYNSNKRDQFRYGFNFNYSLSGANLFAQLIKAKDGALNRTAWYVQPSYKITLKDRKFFHSFEPLFRYGALSENVQQVVSNSLTWDRQEFTSGIITGIYKNINLITEYTIDRIDRGDTAGIKDYGEFVGRLEVEF